MQYYLEKISYYIDLLPALVFLLFIFKIKEKPIWVIFIYCLYSFINNYIILEEVKKNETLNLLLYLFTLLEFLLFSTILYFIIISNAVRRIIFIVSILASVIYTYFIATHKLTGFDSVPTSVECTLVIAFCLYYFYEQLTSPAVEFIYNSYKFWVIVGLLLYLAGAFFLFVFAADLSSVERAKYWPILYVCGIIRNILFAIAVYLSTRPQDEEPYQSLI